MKVCGGKKTNGEACQRPQGWGTDHVGTGRCKLHGGSTLRGEASATFKHGRYSKYLKEDLRLKLQTIEDVGDPLDLLPELQVQRALFADYMGRFQEGAALSAGDIAYLIEWSSEIGKSVERIVKLRNATALTAAEIALIAVRLPEVVRRFIDDPNKQTAFLNELFSGLGYADESQPTLIADGRHD